jgi:hypothetical protein
VSLRNWVEELIAELVVHPNRKGAFGKAIAQAYTLKELKRYEYMAAPDAIATAGETETEHSQNRTWDVQVRSELLERANTITKNLVQRHQNRQLAVWEMARWHRADVQHQELFTAAVDIHGEGYVKQRLICNLLVLEQPPEGKVYGFRFASPRMSAERDLADEKRNLLLLYGWLRQEKPFRLSSDAVEVRWAHLFSRPVSPSQEWFFHEKEVMQTNEFWEFVGVPYEVVGCALKAAGQSLGKRTVKLLRKMAFTRVVRELGEYRGLNFTGIRPYAERP